MSLTVRRKGGGEGGRGGGFQISQTRGGVS